MKTIETKVYTFDELTDRAKDKARDWYRSVALDYEWWEATYKDAANVGLKITSFDLDRNRHACGEFITDALHVADKIVREHGVECETFKTAESFMREREEIVTTAPKDENGDWENEYELDKKIDACESEFLKSILEDYGIMLQHEYEYLLSDEAVDESILANDYTFTEDGKRYG